MANIESCAKSIEQVFFAYMSKNIDERTFCSRLSTAVECASACTGLKKKFDVVIIDGKSEFYGMSCYPSLEQLNNLIVNMNSGNEFKKKWIYDLNQYTIEIDKNVFDKSIIAFNPQELTAMILHEVGHTVYNDKLPERIYISYKQNMSILKMEEKRAVAAIQGVFYSIPVFMACGMHAWNVRDNGVHEEMVCDQVFGLKNYQQHMMSALDKIIAAYGTTLIVPDSDQDTKVGKTFKWCNVNIKDITHRREVIRRDLFMWASSTRSKSFKKACLNIMTKFGIGMKDNYSGNLVATESVVDAIYDGEEQLNGILQKYSFITLPGYHGAMETIVERYLSMSPAAESSRSGKIPKLPTQYDIDEIQIEVDRMENHYDRVYVLDLIHNKLDQIQEFEEYCEYTGESKKFATKIKTMREDLDRLRHAVLRRQDFNKRYGVFVKYPIGYEGFLGKPHK